MRKGLVRIISKILILFIITELIVTVKAHAETSFILSFKPDAVCNMGETVEVPILLHDIDIEGSGLIALSCKIEYADELELVEIDDGEYFRLNEELESYASRVEFNPDTKILSFSLSSNYFLNVSSSFSDYVEFGTMKFKADDNIYSGYYEVSITNIEIGNITIDNTYSSILVNGLERRDHEDVNNSVNKESSLETIRQSSEKEVILDIDVSSDGKKITITADEDNGVPVGYIVVDGQRIDLKDGKFVIETEPNSEYEVYVYDTNGNYLTKKYITTYIEQNNNNNNKENKEEKESSSKEEKKVLKTGDYVLIAAGVLGICLVIIVIVVIIKKKNDKEND